MSANQINLETKAYIDSEGEFRQVRLRGFLERIMGFITQNDMHLLSFDEVVRKLLLQDTVYKGLQDIPIKHIKGSTGRYQEFTRHFLPYSLDKRDKERWRNVYTLAVTGKGFPPIDVYKIDRVYFVKDGNHRVSVASELGWETIQAYVTELPSSISLEPDTDSKELLIKEGCAYFLKCTELDKSRPDSKKYINFTELGGYQNLLHHIRLHRRLMVKRGLGIKKELPLQTAAVDWYDKVYLPAIQTVKQAEIMKNFPDRSASDLYMWLVRNQVELRQGYEFESLSLPPEVREFLEVFDNGGA